MLIESKASTRSALPVASDKRGIYVVPFRFPAIYDIVSVLGDRAPIVVGDIDSRTRPLGDITLVNFDGVDVAPATMTPDRDRVGADSPLPAGIYAGVKGIQIVQKIPMGDPPVDHRGTESNVGAFVLRPTITNGPTIGAADILNVVSLTTETINGQVVQFRAGSLRVKFRPARRARSEGDVDAQ